MQEVLARLGVKPKPTSVHHGHACKARGKTVSSNQDGLACALKADSCDYGSEFQEVDVFLG